MSEKKMKEVKLIMACDKRGLIGNGSNIPWYFPEDFKHFRESTSGNVVVMGRKTWDSLPSKPLKNRDNFIVSRTLHLNTSIYDIPTVSLFVNIEDAYEEWLKNYSNNKHLFVIGGAQIYNEALLKLPVTEVLLTLVNGTYEGDIFFNMEYLKNKLWNIETIKKTNDFEIQRWRSAIL